MNVNVNYIYVRPDNELFRWRAIIPTPDALPELNPMIDLQAIACTLPADFLKTKKGFKAVEAGLYLRPKQVSLCFHSHCQCPH